MLAAKNRPLTTLEGAPVLCNRPVVGKGNEGEGLNAAIRIFFAALMRYRRRRVSAEAARGSTSFDLGPAAIPLPVLLRRSVHPMP